MNALASRTVTETSNGSVTNVSTDEMSLRDRIDAGDRTDNTVDAETRRDESTTARLPDFFRSFRRNDGRIAVVIVEAALLNLVATANNVLSQPKYNFGPNDIESELIKDFAAAYKAEFESEAALNTDNDYGKNAVRRQKLENACYNIMSGAKFRHDGVQKVRQAQAQGRNGLDDENYIKLKGYAQKSMRDGAVKLKACYIAFSVPEKLDDMLLAAGRRVLNQNIKKFWEPLLNGENTQKRGEDATVAAAVQIAEADIDA
jgi:hypothetical protein